MHLELSHLSSRHRNTCIVLGSLAEKLAGLSYMQICTNTTLNYLLTNLVSFLRIFALSDVFNHNWIEQFVFSNILDAMPRSRIMLNAKKSFFPDSIEGI